MARNVCHSPNHPAKHRSETGGCFWTCPKCRVQFCSVCEGTDNGCKTCDSCWFRLNAAILRLFERGRFKAAQKVIRMWWFRNRWADGYREYSLE